MIFLCNYIFNIKESNIKIIILKIMKIIFIFFEIFYAILLYFIESKNISIKIYF